MAKYTYTIFDADPSSTGGTEWPSHDDVEIEADSDQDASDEVRDIMSAESGRCDPVDGYEVGDRLYALVWDENGQIVGDPTYTLTAEDLGVEDSGSEESESENENENDDDGTARSDYDV